MRITWRISWIDLASIVRDLSGSSSSVLRDARRVIDTIEHVHDRSAYKESCALRSYLLLPPFSKSSAIDLDLYRSVRSITRRYLPVYTSDLAVLRSRVTIKYYFEVNVRRVRLLLRSIRLEGDARFQQIFQQNFEEYRSK